MMKNVLGKNFTILLFSLSSMSCLGPCLRAQDAL